MNRFSCSALLFATGALALTLGCPQEAAATKADATVSKDLPVQPTENNTPVATAPAPTKAKAATLVGKPAPEFTLTDLDGQAVKLSAYKGKTVVLEWFNPECPFVKASHGPGSLKDAAARHQKNGVVWLAINSGAPGKQGHALEANKSAVTKWKLGHAVLKDDDGAVGRMYGATNTPQMFVVDKAGTVVYAGAIDNSPDGEGASPEGGTLVNYIDAALGDLAAGQPVKTPVTKAYGCSVKYSS